MTLTLFFYLAYVYCKRIGFVITCSRHRQGQGRLQSQLSHPRDDCKALLDANEQSLFNETVEAFSADFDPQSSIERVLISKLVECTVRLMRIQQTENAMFDLASSEAGHPEESIRSQYNEISSKLE